MSGILLVVLVFFLLAAGLGGVAYFTYRKKLRRAKAIERGLKMVPILIHLPPPSSDTEGGTRDIREVMREKTAQAEVLYNLIGGTATDGFKSKFYGQRHIALEVIAVDGVVHFFAAVPVALVSVVEKAIQTAYPGARLEQVEDHNIFNQEGRLAATLGGEMVLRAESAYPVATYAQLERDPMEALLTTVSALEKKDGVAVQIMIRPANPDWTKKSVALANAKRKGRGQNLKFTAADLAKAAVMSPDARREEERARLGGAPDVSNLQLSEIESIEEKTKHPGFEVLIRVIVSTQSVARSQQLLRDIATAFALFEKPGLNGFKFLPALDVQGLVTAFIFRFFPAELSSNVLNSVELATLFHLPDSQFTPATSVERQKSKQVDGPIQLPSVGLLFGYNDFRGVKKEIRLSPEDRRRHTYILGQTGTGKSTMLENLAVQDMVAGNGFAFIDPHGDSAEKLLAMVPKERAEDVIYFNPADTEYPLGLNLFEFKDPTQKDFIVQETINMLYKLYDPGHTGIIGPRYEHWYRNAALTLMSDPNGATFIEIPKVFTDTDYLKQKFKYLKDPTVIDFWTKEMGQTSDYHKSEMLGWFVSKFGAFQNNEMMRNIIGQTKSAFSIREVMDKKKILIVNLSKGKLGELNSQLLGMIFVIKFQAAAMSRADVMEDQRADFSLYVDEFQNFSTDSFASILSEARKYRLNLIVANQFVGQLSNEIRDAVFGNIGTIVAHRMGPDDAEFMTKQFAPVFEASDLVNIPNYNAAMRLMIGGLPSQPFSIRDLGPLSSPNLELGLAIKQLSAAKYGHAKAAVEADILERFSGQFVPSTPAGPAQPNPPAPAPAPMPEPAATTPTPVPPVEPMPAPEPFPAPAAPAPAMASQAPAPAAAGPAPAVFTAAPAPVADTIAQAPSPAIAPAPMQSVGPAYAPVTMPYAPSVPAPSPSQQPLVAAPAPAAPNPAPAPMTAMVGMAATPPPIGAPPVGVSPDDATGFPPLTPTNDIIDEPNAAAEADRMTQEGGFAPLGAPVAAAPIPDPAVAAASTPIPPPYTPGNVSSSMPVAAPAAPGATAVTPPPIGAPPVALPGTDMPDQAAIQTAAPAPAPASNASTLSLHDITGGRPPKAAAIDPSTVPVMTPGTEPPALQAHGTYTDSKPLAPFTTSAPEPETPAAPLGSGAPMENDPFANIDVLGDLTPLVTEQTPPATQQTTEEVMSVDATPLPNDPHASVDVLGAAPAPAAAPVAPAVSSTATSVEPLAPPVAEQALATPPAPMVASMPLPQPAIEQQAAPAPAPAQQTQAAPEPTLQPVMAQPSQPAPFPEPAPRSQEVPLSEPEPRQQPMDAPAPWPQQQAAAPIATPQQPAPVPIPAASYQTPRPAESPVHVMMPGEAVAEAQPAGDQPLIHFVDPNAQSVLDRTDLSDSSQSDGDEPSLSGLPDGVQIVKPTAPTPPAPFTPPQAEVAPAPAQPLPVAAATPATPPVSDGTIAPPPIGAPPVELSPTAAVAPAPVATTPEPEAAAPVPAALPGGQPAHLSNMAVTPPPIGAAPVDTPATSPVAPQKPTESAKDKDTKQTAAEPVPELNASLAAALQDAPSEPEPKPEPTKDEEAKDTVKAADAKPAGTPDGSAALESVAQMLEEAPEGQSAENKVDKPESGADSKSSGVKAEAKQESAEGQAEQPSAADLSQQPAVPTAGASPQVQIEKAEHEIDDLLSESLIHSDASAIHRRLPEPVEARPQDDNQSGIDMEMNSGRNSAPVGTPMHMAENHHGLKVIQPLEPIVPPKELFARELAALNKEEQAAAAVPAQQPAQTSAPVPAPPKPEEQTVQAPVQAQAAPSEEPKKPDTAPAEMRPSESISIIKRDDRPMPAEEAPSSASATIDEDALPVAESLAVNDVAKARADREAQMAMQKPTPAEAEHAHDEKQASEPAKEPAPAKDDQVTGNHRHRLRGGSRKDKPAETIDSAEEAEHNKPTEAETQQGTLTGKLIMPTGAKPSMDDSQPKAEKPKKLAPGEVFVDDSGNVMIG